MNPNYDEELGPKNLVASHNGTEARSLVQRDPINVGVSKMPPLTIFTNLLTIYTTTEYQLQCGSPFYWMGSLG